VCAMRRKGAPKPGLNRPTLKMEMPKGAVKMCDLGENEVRQFPAQVVRRRWKLGHSTVTMNLLLVHQTVV
jgi:hypothetical protein